MYGNIIGITDDRIAGAIGAIMQTYPSGYGSMHIDRYLPALKLVDPMGSGCLVAPSYLVEDEELLKRLLVEEAREYLAKGGNHASNIRNRTITIKELGVRNDSSD